MKTITRSSFIFLVASLLCFQLSGCKSSATSQSNPQSRKAPSEESLGTAIKLLHITANVDGSGRIIFTSQNVRYEHKHWSPPSEVTFDDQPWVNLDQTPAIWHSLGDELDLTRAWIVKRHGRDTIALEQTPEGFDLYLDDSPNGSADYEVTIAIPRRN